jgi:hypothetical protein
MKTPTKRAPILAAIVHELVKAESFERYADLKEAVKVRCAQLRIPYHAQTVAVALDVVERTRQVVVR